MLCGGRSQRMGRPKALLPWFGRTLIEHVVATLAPCVDETIVVSAAGIALPASIESLGARVVVDSEPARGPLAALRDGLRAARSPVAFVTSTDAPFLTPDHVLALFERAAREAAGSGAQAVVPRAEGHLQVLSAVYSTALGEQADALLGGGDAGPARLLARVGHVAIEGAGEGAVRAMRPAGRPAPWANFNTPDQYLALARAWDRDARAHVEWWPGVASSAERAPASPDTRGAVARVVPIGLLGEIVQALAEELGDPRSHALHITLGDLDLGPEPDLGLPVGPGERVSVRARAGERG